jgi:molybdenum cofactor cytidylyltransferase
MGGAKLLLPVDGRPMVRRVVDAALASSVSQVVVVVGHDRDAVTAALAGAPVATVENPEYAAGMSTSLRAGLAAVDAAADGVLILLGDQPFVTQTLIDTLVEAFIASGKAVVRPAVAGAPGNPVLVHASLIPELLTETGDVGGRHVIARHDDDVCLVEVADARELLDVDSLDEYEKVRET